VKNHFARVALAARLAPLALLAACSHHEVLHPHVPTAYFYDDEPNDDSAYPQPIGPLHPTEQVVIRGHVDCVSWSHYDPTDAFAFAASSPARITFELDAFHGGDLDLCLVDPFLERVVAHWDSYGDEFGSFDVPGHGTEFHLVVVAFSGASEYDLRLHVDHLPYGMPAPLEARALPNADGGDDAREPAAAEREAALAPYFEGGRETRRAEAQRRALAEALARHAERVERAASSR
jgi:hypothetical protein